MTMETVPPPAAAAAPTAKNGTAGGGGGGGGATATDAVVHDNANGNGKVATVNNNGQMQVVQHKKNRIQVSNTKKSLFFYVNLAKRYMQQNNEVELSALGMAITTVVTVAEILKNNGLAVEKRVLTSTVGTRDEIKGRQVQKAKIEIVLTKSEKFDSLLNAAAKNAQQAGAKGKE